MELRCVASQGWDVNRDEFVNHELRKEQAQNSEGWYENKFILENKSFSTWYELIGKAGEVK